MIFETHAHYDDQAFDSDRDLLINQMKNEGIEYIVNIGSGVKETLATLVLTNKYPFVYGTAGVHPSEINDLTEETFQTIEDISREKKILAVGETGLDYHYMNLDKKAQKYWFSRQISLAKEISKPLIIHSREASKDTLDIIRGEKARDTGGVIHCYSYSKETAKEYLNMGFYLGIGGVVTFRNARVLKEVVEYMPLSQILLETDAPYLAPEPFRGKRNNSLFLTYVIKEIAHIKKISEKEVEEVTFENARQMYKI